MKPLFQKFFQSCFGAGLVFLLSSTAIADELIPVEAFATPPDIRNVSLSPDGKNLAFLRRIATDEADGVAITVVNLQARTQEMLAFANVDDYVIKWIRWAGNERILTSAIFPAVRYGVPTTETRLLVTDISTKESRSAFSNRFLRRQERVPQFQDQIVDMLTSDDDHILLSARLTNSDTTTVLKVNLENGRIRTEHKKRSHVYRWMTDRQERLRIALWRDDTTYRVLHRSVDNREWNVLWEYEAFAEDQVSPMGFGKDPNVLYVSAYHEGRRAIFKVDLDDPSLALDLVFSHHKYDADGNLVYSKMNGEVVGTRFSADGGATFWEDSYRDFQESIDMALPETINSIYGLSDDERYYVVLSSSDTDPGKYYIGDRQTNQLALVSRRMFGLDAARMSEKMTIRYQARDGLEIEGFLTIPKGKEPASLPAIVFPHGGPIAFSDGGFDYWTQYFASRGFAVLQMNFRGSAGYGYDFMKSGLQSWGLEMQNDVEDGARWLISEGIADADRICVVGASYGGYAALMEAARNSDLYQCAVSFAGVVDVAYLVSSSRRYTNYRVVKQQIGSDLGELRDRSPLYLVEQIDVPVLLGHGTDDRSVRVRHSRKMQQALERKGKRSQYLEFDGGDHYLSDPEHRLEFFTAMDRFLRTHIVEE